MHHIKRSDFSNKLLQQKKLTYFKMLSNVIVWTLKDRFVDARLDIWFRSTDE